MQLLGGTVGLSSKVGKGSTFFFDLPVTVAQAAEKKLEEHEGTQLPDMHVHPPAASKPEAKAEPLQDPLQGMHCLVLSAVEYPLCSYKLFLQKNNIPEREIKPDCPELLEEMRSGKYKVMMICLHGENDKIVRAMEMLASEAIANPDAAFLADFPIVLVASREAVASRRQIPGFGFCFAFKSTQASQFSAEITAAIIFD